MNLARLLNNIKTVQVVGKAESKEILELSIDSRKVTKGCVYFAIEGFKVDGHKFIEEVISKGADAVVLNKDGLVPDQLFVHSGCVKILVDDPRKSLAEFSKKFYNDPSSRIKLFAITGTKGKTTTAFYLKNILETAGQKTGLIGTIANYIGNIEVSSSLTTPQSHEINSLLNDMLAAGCNSCVMEVSSHALRLDRVTGLKFTSAVFTNITSDHMDYHKTFEHYFESKKILFDSLDSDSVAITNYDDENGKLIVKDSNAKKVSYGESDKCDFKISNIKFDLEGTNYQLLHKSKTYNVNTKLVGHFNAHNSAAAFACAVSSGISAETVIKGIANTPQVPGRFEVISAKDKKVIIDYSHTADSLKQVLNAIHHIVGLTRPIYTVFGCGGDRDRTKRPVMGEIASSKSNRVYVTSDNPRTEDPYQIIDEILKGIKQNNYRIIEDREEAIRAAIYESEDNAVILIAGKGHESYQEINGVKKHFSDIETAKKYLEQWAN
jgi:UDP-N-acetylmuramoyl-L-alanyl-D-glutamate--2,6-diaminopimelate ligase